MKHVFLYAKAMKPEIITERALALISDRIIDLADKAKGKDRIVYEELAKKCGTTKATISRLARREYGAKGGNISFVDMMKYVQGLQIPLSQMFQGGQMGIPAINGVRVGSEGDAEALSQKGLTVLGVYAVAGAGQAWEADQSEPIFNIAVPKLYLRPQITPLFIKGSSMEPTILDNAVVGVNREQREVVQGKIYAVRLPYEGIVVKRLYLDHETKSFILRSDNKKDGNEFPDIHLPFDSGDSFIYGQVSWVLQSYDR